MQHARLAYLFERYMNQQCTAEEFDELMVLVDESDDVALHQLLDNAYTGAADHQLPDAAANRILQQIIEKKPVYKSRSLRYWLTGIAATFLLAGGLYFWQEKNALPETVAAQTVQSLNDHRQVRLSDGSTVTLNKNSHLVYAKNFNGKTREVTLKGEGYFDIKHDASKPFLVHAGGLTITVLGTAFNVNTAGKVAVTVTRGKVSVSHKQVLLGAIIPNQQINFDTRTKTSKRVSLNAVHVVKWQATDMFFDNVTMAQAAEMLEERFSKKILFENEQAKNCAFSGAFTHGEKLEDILKVICAFHKATYDEKDNAIIIKGNGC